MLDAQVRASLRARMEALKLRPVDLAVLTENSPQAVSGWLNTGKISLENFTLLTRALRTTIDEVLTGNEHNLPADEMELVENYRWLPDEEKEQVRTCARDLQERSQRCVETYLKDPRLQTSFREATKNGLYIIRGRYPPDRLRGPE